MLLACCRSFTRLVVALLLGKCNYGIMAGKGYGIGTVDGMVCDGLMY